MTPEEEAALVADVADMKASIEGLNTAFATQMDAINNLTYGLSSLMSGYVSWEQVGLSGQMQLLRLVPPPAIPPVEEPPVEPPVEETP